MSNFFKKHFLFYIIFIFFTSYMVLKSFSNRVAALQDHIESNSFSKVLEVKCRRLVKCLSEKKDCSVEIELSSSKSFNISCHKRLKSLRKVKESTNLLILDGKGI